MSMQRRGARYLLPITIVFCVFGCLGWFAVSKYRSSEASLTPPEAPISKEGSAAGSSNVDLVEGSTPTARTPQGVNEAATDPLSFLSEDWSFEVLVTDPSGAPLAGIPVELVVTYSRSGKYLHSKGLIASGGDGIATFIGHGDLFRSLFGEASPGVTSLGVCYGRLDADESGEPTLDDIVWVNQPGLLDSPIVLRLDSIGWLEVFFAPASSTAPCVKPPNKITWRRYDNVDHARPMRARGSSVLESGASSVVLGPFGIGWDLRIQVGRSGSLGDLADVNAAGPIRPFETARVNIEPVGTVTITGHVVNQSGEPLRTTKMNISLSGEAYPRPLRSGFETDEDGNWTMEAAAPMRATNLLIESRHLKPASRAEIRLNPSSMDDPCLVDVGTVALLPQGPPERFLVSGRVVDAGGQPVRRARVSIFQNGGNPTPLAIERTGSDGRFSFSESLDEGADFIRLFASHKKFLTSPGIEVDIGRRDLRVVLERGAGVAGEVQVDDDIPPGQILIRLRSKEGTRVLSLTEFGAEFQGEFQGLDDGPHMLSFEIRKTDWVLLEVPVVMVTGLTHEIEPVNLRNKLSLVQMLMIAEDGSPIGGEEFSVRDRSGLGYRNVRSDAWGELRLVIPKDVSELYVSSSKHARKAVGVQERQIVLVRK